MLWMRPATSGRSTTDSSERRLPTAEMPRAKGTCLTAATCTRCATGLAGACVDATACGAPRRTRTSAARRRPARPRRPDPPSRRPTTPAYSSRDAPWKAAGLNQASAMGAASCARSCPGPASIRDAAGARGIRGTRDIFHHDGDGVVAAPAGRPRPVGRRGNRLEGRHFSTRIYILEQSGSAMKELNRPDSLDFRVFPDAAPARLVVQDRRATSTPWLAS